ncbi:MAG TPA: hypothetical protein VHN82_06330, partial [Methanoregula sp.]|nr:hypothetical protein [Methanoregula sp.]
TESNIQALRLARVQNCQIKEPNVIIPESAHFSFKKACDMLSLEIKIKSWSRSSCLFCARNVKSSSSDRPLFSIFGSRSF